MSETLRVLKCFFGYHKHCSKTYVSKDSYVLIYCKDSQKYIGKEHMEDSNVTVTFSKEKAN